MEGVEIGSRFFRHSDGCGTYYRKCWMRIGSDNQVTLVVYYGCMGSKKVNLVLDGELLHISGPYHVLQTTHYTDFGEKEPTKVEKGVAFDVYVFDEPLLTEWLQRQDKICIGLYCGNGCHCTEKFQVHIVANHFIGGNDDLVKLLKPVHSVKLEACTEQDYQNGLVCVMK